MLQGNLSQSMALSKAQNQYVLGDVLGLEALSSSRKYCKTNVCYFSKLQLLNDERVSMFTLQSCATVEFDSQTLAKNTINHVEIFVHSFKYCNLHSQETKLSDQGSELISRGNNGSI